MLNWGKVLGTGVSAAAKYSIVIDSWQDYCNNNKDTEFIEKRGVLKNSLTEIEKTILDKYKIRLTCRLETNVKVGLSWIITGCYANFLFIEPNSYEFFITSKHGLLDLGAVCLNKVFGKSKPYKSIPYNLKKSFVMFTDNTSRLSELLNDDKVIQSLDDIKSNFKFPGITPARIIATAMGVEVSSQTILSHKKLSGKQAKEVRNEFPNAKNSLRFATLTYVSTRDISEHEKIDSLFYFFSKVISNLDNDYYIVPYEKLPRK